MVEFNFIQAIRGPIKWFKINFHIIYTEKYRKSVKISIQLHHNTKIKCINLSSKFSRLIDFNYIVSMCKIRSSSMPASIFFSFSQFLYMSYIQTIFPSQCISFIISVLYATFHFYLELYNDDENVKNKNYKEIVEIKQGKPLE